MAGRMEKRECQSFKCNPRTQEMMEEEKVDFLF